MDKVMLSLTNFAAEMEREKARQRTYDAMVRKARALHVTGGKVYGYSNVDVLDPAGERIHVTRKKNADEAAVIRRIFEMYAAGVGMTTIAKTLNAEHVRPPRGRGGRKLMGRPRFSDESAYLLTGFAKCAACGGPVGTDLRGFGSNGSRRHVPYYVCLDHKRRGTCANAVALQQTIIDRALLG